MAWTEELADNGETVARDGFVGLMFGRTAVLRASRVSLLVGTLLVAINQGDVLLAGAFPPLWKIVLTYVVPFAVSSYSTAALLFEQQAQMRPPSGLDGSA